MQSQTTKENAIAYYTTDGVIKPEVQTTINVYRPSLQTEGYAPAPAVTRGDRLPAYIAIALLAALVVMAGIHFMDKDKQKLQADNAKLEAQSNAIAGCIKGVTGQ